MKIEYIIIGVFTFILFSAGLIFTYGIITHLLELSEATPDPTVLGASIEKEEPNINTIIKEAPVGDEVNPEELVESYGRYKAMTGTPLDMENSDPYPDFVLSWPVEGGLGLVTQCVDGTHNGIDIADYSYPDIIAAADGEVVLSGCYHECPPDRVYVGGQGLARTVMIRHGNGLTTVYGHLHEIYVEKGQKVERGDTIARMGQTGDVIGGVHLHFSLIEDGKWDKRDPAQYLDRSVCENGMPDEEAYYVLD